MSRLKLLNPGNYRATDRISQDFENVVRYINAAEYGDKTVGELLAQLFDDNGDFVGPIEMQYDTTEGLQYRVGTYTDEDGGWITIAAVGDLRGAAGSDVGTIAAPVFSGRTDYVATASQTTFAFVFDDDETPIVWKNGLLQREGGGYDYTKNESTNVVIFNAPLAVSTKVSISKVRTDTIQGYVRSDIISTAAQVVFAFVHTENQILMVYRNGILQRFGGGYDYTTSATTDTITFTSGLTNGDNVTIMTVEDRSTTSVSGLMTEADWVVSGSIPSTKLSFANDSIPQAKISGLAATLSNRGKVYVSSSAPVSPNSGDGWLDTSQSPDVFNIWNGSVWVETSPNINIPDFDSTKASKVLRVNSSGTALEWVTVDLSSRIAAAAINAVNGVCPLDSEGLVPVDNLPDIFSQGSVYREITGLTATSYTMRVIFSQTTRIDSIVLKTNVGTCNVEIEVDGVVVSAAPISANVTLTATSLPTSITVNANSSPRRIGVKVTTLVSSPTILEVSLATSEVTV